MSTVFFVIALLTLASAITAMSLRNLVHCALFAALTFAGLAAVFLQLCAQFVGLAQVLVYVGAVAILIVFAILLTRGSEPSAQPFLSKSWWVGLIIALLVAVSLAGAVLATPSLQKVAKSSEEVSQAAAVGNIGIKLMTTYAVPLEIIALLLTAATIGAVIIAMPEKEDSK